MVPRNIFELAVETTFVVMVVGCVPSTLPLAASLLPPCCSLALGPVAHIEEVFLYTCTRKSGFFARGVDDENFVHLEINFD